MQSSYPLFRRFRFSPTAIVEGREQQHLQNLVHNVEDADLKRVALQQAHHAKLQNITDPFQKEKEQIAFEFADPKSALNFQDAWLKIDEVEQRESEQL